MRLENKVAVITGAANGIGKETALLFAKEGAKVIGCDMIPLTYEHENVEGLILDVTDVNSCSEVFNTIVAKYSKIDILVNNAGITRDSLTAKMTDDQWDKVIDVNLKGVFNLTRLVGPLMSSQKTGSIINISSITGQNGNVGQANYAATKAGVVGLAKTWAKEFARKGEQVRVNAIAPGFILTDIVKTIPKEISDGVAQTTMLKRLGQPEEVAKVALFLASDDSSYVTGEVINVTGGL